MNDSNPFTPFFPLNINGNIFSDPTLTDIQKIIIAVAQTHRLKIAYAKSEKEQQELFSEISSSLFSRATGKHRDHIRRIINQMQNDKNVQKYLSIFIVPRNPVHLNAEQLFKFTFKDQLPDQFSVTHKTTPQLLANKIEFHLEELINFYLRDLRSMKVLMGETAASLLELIGCKPDELIKGLRYLKQKIKSSDIKSPKAYLITSFQDGYFKYVVKNYETIPTSSDSKTTRDFLFKIPLQQMELLELTHKQQESKFRFFYMKENNFALIQEIKYAGRNRNVQNFLMREDIKFEIVAAVNYGK